MTCTADIFLNRTLNIPHGITLASPHGTLLIESCP